MADTLRTYLNKKLRVTVSDGRMLLGKLLCTDRDSNLVVSSCLEYMSSSGNDSDVKHEPRLVGIATVPGRHIVKIEIREHEDENDEDDLPLSIVRRDEKSSGSLAVGSKEGVEAAAEVCADGRDGVDEDRTGTSDSSNVVSQS